MSLPRPFFPSRLKLAALTAARGCVNIANELDRRAGELSEISDDEVNHGHGHGPGRNRPGSFRKPGTGRKYHVRS